MENVQLQLQLFKQRLAQHVSNYEEAITQLQAELLVAQERIKELEGEQDEEEK